MSALGRLMPAEVRLAEGLTKAEVSEAEAAGWRLVKTGKLSKVGTFEFAVFVRVFGPLKSATLTLADLKAKR